jgi:hypothetical protein
LKKWWNLWIIVLLSLSLSDISQTILLLKERYSIQTPCYSNKNQAYREYPVGLYGQIKLGNDLLPAILFSRNKDIPSTQPRGVCRTFGKMRLLPQGLKEKSQLVRQQSRQ